MRVLAISGILFSLGAYGVMTKKNVINLLMCIEIMFNAANLNLVYFSRFGPVPLVSAQVFTVLAIAMAAAETAVGLALALAIYRRWRVVETDDMDLMRG